MNPTVKSRRQFLSNAAILAGAGLASAQLGLPSRAVFGSTKGSDVLAEERAADYTLRIAAAAARRLARSRLFRR